MSLEWALGDVHDVVSAEIPDRVMLVHGEERRTYRQVNDRARALASFLTGRGFGAFRERDELEPVGGRPGPHRRSWRTTRPSTSRRSSVAGRRGSCRAT